MSWPVPGLLPPGVRPSRVRTRPWRADPPRRRNGFVLLLALLVLLVLGVAGAALVSVGTQQGTIAAARVEAMRARLSAESGARAAVAAWTSGELRLGASGERQPGPSGDLLGGGRYASQVEPLGGGVVLVVGEGGAPGPGLPATARAAMLLRTLDVERLPQEFPAALVVGGPLRVEPTAELRGRAGDEIPFPAHTCGPAEQGTEGPAILLGGPDLLVDDGAYLEGLPPVLHASTAGDEPGLDRLVHDSLLSTLADLVLEGSARFTPPPPGDFCADGGSIAGISADAVSPCAPAFPLLVSQGDLRITGGAGQGVLLVQGDLVLERGAVFFGPVVVTGSLTLTQGAAIRGGVRLLGQEGSSSIGGLVSRDECLLRHALAEAPGLRRPFRAGTRLWVPQFSPRNPR